MESNFCVSERPTASATMHDVLVPVQRQWDSWKTAEARLCDLDEVHWFQPPGAPRALLHAYVNRSVLTAGTLTDEINESTPQRLLVCVLKCHIPAAAYSALSDRADQSHATLK